MYYLCSPRITYKILIFMTHHKNSSLSVPGCVSRRLLSVALLVFLLCMTGCKGSSKDSDDEDDKDSKIKSELKSELIVGYWELACDDPAESRVLAFLADSTFHTAAVNPESGTICIELSAKYTVKGKELVLVYQNYDEPETKTIYKLASNTLIISPVDHSKGKQTFRRITEERFNALTGNYYISMQENEEEALLQPATTEQAVPDEAYVEQAL